MRPDTIRLIMRALPAAIAFLLILSFFGFMGCAGLQEPASESPAPGATAEVPAAAPLSDGANAAADETTSTGDDLVEEPVEIADAASEGEPSGAEGPPDEVAATADPAREVVFDSSAVPMTEPQDTGLTLDLQGELNHPELSQRQALDEPLPPPLPDPLDGDQINRLVFTGIGEGLLPVHRSGSAVYLLHDLDGNGYSDVFALALRVEKREDAEFANIRDYTRLYKPERKAARFYLRLFYQRNGTLVPADLVSLGERLVMDSFHPQAIVEGENSPFAVSIAFTTLQGRVREWVIFTGGEPGRFSMQERAGEIPVIEDIDSDGVIDVLIYEKVYEIGIGNETYITWNRWNGLEFVPVATVNIVRNLREFLETAFDLMSRREWESFSDHALSKSIRGAYPEEMYSDFSVFQQAFELAVVEESFKNRPLDPSESIRRAVYPEIRENPFSQRDSAGFFFPLSVRFKTDSGHNHLYTTRVYMLPNPFGERQFTFSLGAEEASQVRAN